MAEATWLNWLLWLPVLGMVAIALVPRGRDSLVRGITLGVMFLQLLIALLLYQRFDGNVSGLQFATDLPWITEWGVGYRIGLDGLNILLVVLTAFLGPLVPGMLAGTIDEGLFGAPPADEDPEGLLRLGVLSLSKKREVFLGTLEQVVFPGLEKFGVDPEPGRRWLAHAAGLR